jgi:hypothetical protein
VSRKVTHEPKTATVCTCGARFRKPGKLRAHIEREQGGRTIWLHDVRLNQEKRR